MPHMKVVSSRALANCPNFILTAQHYIDAPDNRCRCFIKDAPEMAAGGYRWDKAQGRWTS